MSLVNRPDEDISPDEAIEEAMRVAAVLRRQCVQLQAEEVTWNSWSYDPASKERAVRPMGFCLYDGICGPALFLAAVEQVSGGAGFRDLLAMIAEQVTSQLGPRAVQAAGLGAGTGVPSVIYTFARMAACLGDSSFLDKAEGLSGLINEDLIGKDSTYDLIGGSAGCIVALLAAHRMRPSAGFLVDLAIRCGEHLLARRRRSHAGFSSWPTMDGRLYTGFAHGAAGIAYALAALAAACGKDKFRDAALEACAFENTLFVQHTCNWRECEEDSSPGTQHFEWCHGAPGIGLSRMGMLHLEEAFLLQDGLCAATKAAITRPAEIDHACCGNVGRIELMLVAGEQNEIYERRARQLAGFILRRARNRGNYTLGVGSDHDNVSFHQGIAGIGYQWLRLADPSHLASVLLWQ